MATTPHAHFQQSWEWGELAPALGGTAVRLMAVEGTRPVGAMQVFLNPIHGTGLQQIYVPRGPAVCDAALQVLGPLMDAAWSLAAERRAIGVRMDPNVPTGDAEWRSALAALGLRPSYPPTQPRSSWVLPITEDEEALLGGMKQKTRYNIRLSARKGVEVTEGTIDDLDVFYPIYQETASRDDFFIHPRSFYRHMFQVFGEAGNFALLLARKGGQVLAGVTLIRFGETCWYMQGASSNEHRNLMPTYLLQWEAIRWARRHGCTLYDFRAVPDVLREDQDMYGVYRFKEGFGGHQFSTLDTHAAAYRPLLFGLWHLYFSGRFALDAWNRRRDGLPARQFA